MDAEALWGGESDCISKQERRSDVRFVSNFPVGDCFSCGSHFILNGSVKIEYSNLLKAALLVGGGGIDAETADRARTLRIKRSMS